MDMLSKNKIESAEAIYRNLIMGAPALFCILIGKQHVFEFANLRYKELVGNRDIIGKPIREALPELEGQGFYELLDKVYSTGETFYGNEVPANLIKDDGRIEQGYFNFTYQAYTNENNETEGIFVFANEVTEQVNARIQIEESEKRFSMLADSIPNLAWMAYSDGNIFWYNKKWFEYTGTTLAEMQGWGWQSVHDPEKLPKVLLKWKRSIETGKPFEMVFPLKGADGMFRPFLTRVLPVLDNENKIYRWFGTNTDISKQIEIEERIKESEAKFRTVSEAIPHMIWTATPDGKKNFFNKYFLDYTGLSFEKLKGDGWQMIIFPDDLEKELAQWHYALKIGEDFKIEKRVRHYNGNYRWHLCHGIAQKNAEGKVSGWIGTNTDIHEQKTLAEENFLTEFADDFSHYETGTEFFNSLVKYIANKTGIDYVFIGELTEKEKDIFSIKTIALANRGKLVPNIEYPLPDGPCEQVIRGTLYKYPNQCKITFPKNETLVQFNVEGYVGYPLFDSDEKAIGLVAVMHEKEILNSEYISALLKIIAKRAEFEMERNRNAYKLHIQNETFRQAEESSMQGSYSFNLTTGKLDYSANLYRLIGYLPNEFEPSLEEFNNHVHPDDRDFVTQSAQKVLERKKGDEWHYRMVTQTGAIIYIKGTGRVIESGDEELLVGTLQDVTKDILAAEALKEKEDYLKQIINNAPDAVIVINDKSIITLWNPKTEEIFGWKSEEVLGLHLTDTIIPPHYRKAHTEGMKRLLTTGEPQILNKTLELSALNKEGKEFPVSLTVSQAVQQGNKLFIAFLRDITLEKQNKEELIVKSKQLEEVNQTLKLKNNELENSNAELASFSYVASHDLQEPLRKIQAFSKRIIESEKFSGKAQDYFNRIISAGERMQNLIVSLLEFSRTNTTELIFEPCNLNTIVEDSINYLHESILEKKAILESENLPTINGVNVQLEQLITNLIDNAIKYSRPGINPHIKISSSIIEGREIEHPAVNKQRVYHAIKITDNGIGFEKEYATKIFELFQRLHGKNEYSGTGIGLAIVNKIVTNHYGFIIAVGKPNIGSTFTIYIPI